MSYWAVMFLVIALIAGVLGFGDIASAATGVSRVLSSVFLVLFVVTLSFSLLDHDRNHHSSMR